MHGDSRFYDPRGGDCQVLSEPDERRVRGKSSTEASRSSAGSYAERPARADTTPPASTAPDPLGDAVGGSSGRSTNLRLRSEEHTSELQSQSNLVCRLLLEKKKK